MVLILPIYLIKYIYNQHHSAGPFSETDFLVFWLIIKDSDGLDAVAELGLGMEVGKMVGEARMERSLVQMTLTRFKFYEEYYDLALSFWGQEFWLLMHWAFKFTKQADLGHLSLVISQVGASDSFPRCIYKLWECSREHVSLARRVIWDQSIQHRKSTCSQGIRVPKLQ